MMEMQIRIFLKTRWLMGIACTELIRKIDKWNVYKVLLTYQAPSYTNDFSNFPQSFHENFSCLLVRNRLELVAE